MLIMAAIFSGISRGGLSSRVWSSLGAMHGDLLVNNYAQIGILTNVCIVQVPPCQMQWDQTLAI